MKKLTIITILTMLMLAVSVSAYDQPDNSKLRYSVAGLDIGNVTQTSTLNFTCTGVQTTGQILTEELYNTTAGDELVVACNDKLYMLSSTLQEIDQLDIGTGDIDSQPAIYDIDADGQPEIIAIVYNDPDYDYTVFSTENGTLTQEYSFNVNGSGKADMYCGSVDGSRYCYYHSGEGQIVAFDSTATSINDNVTDTFVGSWTNQQVVVVDFDQNGNEDICVVEGTVTREVKCINITGVLTYNESFTGGIETHTFAAYYEAELDEYKFIITEGSTTTASTGTETGYISVLASDGDEELAFSIDTNCGGTHKIKTWGIPTDINADLDIDYCLLTHSDCTGVMSMTCKENNIFETTQCTDTLSGQLPPTIEQSVMGIDYDSDSYKDVLTDNGIMELVKVSGTECMVMTDVFDENMTDSYAVSLFDYQNDADGYYDIISNELNTLRFRALSSPEEIEAGVPSYVTFTGDGPFQQIQGPVCINQTLPFACSYADGCVEDDTEYSKFKVTVDCNNDGSYEYVSTFFENDPFSTWSGCDLDQLGLNLSDDQATVNFIVWDTTNTSINSTWSVPYSYSNATTGCYTAETPGTIINDTVVNVPPKFIGVPKAQTSQPYCEDSPVIFDCKEGVCYQDLNSEGVSFIADCNNDGVYETEPTVIGAETFQCTFTNSSATRFRVLVVDAGGLNDTTNVSIWVAPVGVSTACTDSRDVSTLAGDNQIKSFFGDLGNVFGMTASTFAWLWILVSTLTIIAVSFGFGGGSSNATGVAIGTVLTFSGFWSILNMIAFSVLGIFSIGIVISLIVVSVGFIVFYRVLNPSGGM